MGLIRSQSTDIIIEISDKVVGSTTIKRKAEVHALSYSLKDKSVTVSIMILPYASIEGSTEYGESLIGVSGFSGTPKNLIANMTTLVDIVTGIPFGGTTLLGDQTANEPGGLLDGKNYMYEFEFYKMIAQSEPIIIDDMIASIIQRADADGRL